MNADLLLGILASASLVTAVEPAPAGSGPNGARPAATEPSTATAGPASSEWVLQHLEAPREIGLGTMTVNLWARFARRDATPLESCFLVLRDDRGQEVRVDMTPVDGAFDGPAEEVVASVDTYAWVRDAAHPWEIRAQSPGGAPSVVARGAIRVKPRISTPDLVLFDSHGMVHAWVGSGAGGFTPGVPLETGLPGGAPVIVDFDGDGLPDVVAPTRDGVVHLLRNTGFGQLALERSIDGSQDLAACAVGDVDGDGQKDLVTAGVGGLLEIYAGLAATPTASVGLRFAPDCLELVDFDGRGGSDICVGLVGATDGEVHVIRSGHGDWDAVQVLSPPEGGRGRVRELRSVPAESGRGEDLLILAASSGCGSLESWGRGADTETVPGLRTGVRLAGEPIAVVSGRFQGKAAPAVRLVLVRSGGGAELIAIGIDSVPRPVGRLETIPEAVAALDLDGDGDDDLATAAADLRLWINLGGRGFREAGESPYLLETPAVGLATGSFDERLP